MDTGFVEGLGVHLGEEPPCARCLHRPHADRPSPVAQEARDPKADSAPGTGCGHPALAPQWGWQGRSSNGCPTLPTSPHHCRELRAIWASGACVLSPSLEGPEAGGPTRGLRGKAGPLVTCPKDTEGGAEAGEQMAQADAAPPSAPPSPTPRPPCCGRPRRPGP